EKNTALFFYRHFPGFLPKKPEFPPSGTISLPLFTGPGDASASQNTFPGAPGRHGWFGLPAIPSGSLREIRKTRINLFKYQAAVGSCMFDTVIARAKGLLMNPVGTFQASRDDTAKTVFSYFGVLLVFYALLSAIVTALTLSAMSALGMYSAMLPALGMGFAVLMPVLVFLMVLIFCTIFTLVAGAWVHLLVWILGGKNGIMQTMKAIAYGMT